MKIIKRVGLVMTGALILLSCLLVIPYTRAIVVMSLLTEIEKGKLSQMPEIQIPIKAEIQFPTTELNWFPKMIWFDASSEFNHLHGTNLSLLVLYSFGDFKEGTSSVFDKTSPYYSSFYGAYVIKDPSYPENISEIAAIPIYDYENLILRDLGDPNYKGAFHYDLTDIKENVDYMDLEGWTQYDIDIQTHGLWHKKDRFINHYIQFGIPKGEKIGTQSVNFENVNLKGRLYYKRIDDNDTIVMYIITPNLHLLNQTDQNLLSKSKLKP